MRFARVVVCSAVVVACSMLAAGSFRAQTVEEGFTPLFDGRTLTNWHTISLGQMPGTWWARDGILSFESGDSWLVSDATYTDFVLRLEYRTGLESDSGIFLRSTPTGYPSFTGMELEIRNDAGGPATTRSTSAIYGAVAPLRNATKPAGEWNAVEVSVIGRRLQATWNGVAIHDVDLDDPHTPARSGDRWRSAQPRDTSVSRRTSPARRLSFVTSASRSSSRRENKPPGCVW